MKVNRRTRTAVIACAALMVGAVAFVGCGGVMTQERDIWIDVTVPNAGWDISIQKVCQTETELCVVSRLTSAEEPSGMVISTASDSVQIDAPPLPVKHFVVGKTWSWKNDEPYVFVERADELPEELDTAKLIYEKE
ncbi:MAG: hypothetical protein K9N51_13900 [Candidatus Pacebacteria bacterium]|nr:hypothetical protein [Candidatus Paceibacterota bacterium]